MKNLFLLFAVFLPAICFAQACKHVAYSSLEHYGSGEVYPFSETKKLDATRTLVYSRVKYLCKICKKWYEEKTNLDTLGIDAPQLDEVKIPGTVMSVAQFKRMKVQQANAELKLMKAQQAKSKH